LAAQHPEHAEEVLRLLPALQVFGDMNRCRLQEKEGSADSSCLATQPPGHAERLVPAHQVTHPGEAGALCGALRLGDYRIHREAGRGGMGVVYEAEQVSLGRRVALKILPFAAVLDPKHLERFRNEAHAAALLHHTNIVPVFSIGCERGVHFYAMQFIDGHSLQRVIEDLRRRSKKDRGATTASRAFFRTVAKLGLQAAEALRHAHEKGIVHRDIKPSNLILDRQRNLWVTDFGLARIEGSQSLTLTGDLLGTLRYMSPEQAATSKAPVDHRTDIYSLGLTLYELITLKYAFPGDDRRLMLQQISNEEPPRPSKLNRGLPADLETIVLKAMAKDPNQRYESARRLAEDLKRFLAGRPILAKRPALVTRAFKWCRRHKLVVGTAAAVLVALLSLGTLIHERRVATGLLEASSYREMILGGITLLHASSEPPGAQEKVESPPATSGEVRPEAPAFICCSQTDQMGAWVAALKENGGHSPVPFEAAVEQFEDAAQLLPSRPDAHYYLARALWTLGRKERALDEVSQVLRLDPGSLAAAALRSAIEGKDGKPYSHPENGVAGADSEQNILPRAWLKFYVAATSNGWKDAAEAASTALERIHRGERCYDGIEAELLLGRATARLEMGEFLGAIDDLSSVRRFMPHSLMPPLLLAHAYYGARDPVRAAECFEEIFRSGDRKDMIAKEIAATYQLLGERENALAWAKRIELSSLRNEVTSHYLSHLGRREEALKAARKAVELDPKNPKNRDRLGACHYEQDQYDDALREYQLCVELDPTVADYHQNLGVTLLEMGRFDQAESELKEAIRLDPQSPVFYENLSKVYARTGRLDLAVASVRKYLAIPGSRKTHETRFWLAQVLYDQGKLEEALGEQTKGLEQVPTNGREHYKRGFLLYRMDRLPEAVAEYEKAMLLSPEDFTPCTSLGELLFSMGGEDKGEELLLKAAELAPQSPVPCFTLARCFLQQRKHDDAIAHFEKAVERYRPGDKALEVWGPGAAAGLWLADFGTCFLAKGRNAEAAECYEKAVAAFEKLPERKRRELSGWDEGTVLDAYEFLARNAAAAGNEQLARQTRKKLFEILQRIVAAPNAAATHFNHYAWTLLTCEIEDLRDPKAALPLAQRAVELTHGQDFASLDTLALALFLTGDVARAVATSEKALSLLPPPSPDDGTKRLLVPGAPDMSVAELRKALEENLARFKTGLTAGKR
ncbi:MAG TPA: tetratricopeptide repeat protein, partial [Planctomycetota bacterium]|nr:tetratricopeptide repeat protein [Planctomycetota bacterium]